VKTFNDLTYSLGMRVVVVVVVVIFAGDVVMITSNHPTSSLIEPMIRGMLCKEWVR
jgi:hypothetical protein